MAEGNHAEVDLKALREQAERLERLARAITDDAMADKCLREADEILTKIRRIEEQRKKASGS